MRHQVVLIHGASGGPWTMQAFADYLTERGCSCRLPTLRHHEPGNTASLAGLSIQDYTDDLAGLVDDMDQPPVLIGHSMGGVIVQKLAERGLASGAVLINSSPIAGVLPTTDDERGIGRLLMAGGAFWERELTLDFKPLAELALNAMPPDQQRAIFDRMGPESGHAFFELFFWMFDERQVTAIAAHKVACPLLVASGTLDRGVSPANARQIVQHYGGRASLHEVPGGGHYMQMEPGWERLASTCADWMEREVPAG